MPKVGKSRIKVGDSDDYLEIEFEVSVNVEGEFTTTLNQADADIINTYGIELKTNGKRNGRQGFFKSDTKSDLVKQVHSVLEQCYSRTIEEEKIVIRYAIETACSFGLSLAGDIVPNLSWSRDGKLDQETYWLNGTRLTSATTPAPSGIQFYVRPAKRIVWKYLNGRTKVEYQDCSLFGASIANEDQYYLAWLEGIASMSKPGYASLKEMDYTEERAKFFVEMYKSICKMANSIAQFIEPEALIQLAESGKYLMPPSGSSNDQI